MGGEGGGLRLRERERPGIISGSRDDVNEIALINLGLRERQRGRERNRVHFASSFGREIYFDPSKGWVDYDNLTLTSIIKSRGLKIETPLIFCPPRFEYWTLLKEDRQVREVTPHQPFNHLDA